VGPEIQVASRATDALRLGAAGMLTEFDVCLIQPVNQPYGVPQMRATLDACDAAGHGYLGWDVTCLYQGSPAGTLFAPAVREMARPMPLAIAGTHASWAFNATDMDAPTFVLRYTHNASVAAASAGTLVYVSTGLWYDVSGLDVAVDSVPAGCVAASVAVTPGQVSLPAANATRLQPETPFSYAVVTVSNAAAPPAACDVTLTVSVRQM
jgi:hypothetical protein